MTTKMYTHILLAADLTDENNEDVPAKARALADLFGAKLSLLHVVESIPNYGFIGIAELEDKLLEEGKQRLAELGKTFGVPELDQWIVMGSAKQEIIHAAKELKCDLIVIGSHTGLHLSDILGSTTNTVLHHAPCDVITIRHQSILEADQA